MSACESNFPLSPNEEEAEEHVVVPIEYSTAARPYVVAYDLGGEMVKFPIGPGCNPEVGFDLSRNCHAKASFWNVILCESLHRSCTICSSEHGM